MSERCERGSEWTSEWSSTYVWVLGYPGPYWRWWWRKKSCNWVLLCDLYNDPGKARKNRNYAKDEPRKQSRNEQTKKKGKNDAKGKRKKLIFLSLFAVLFIFIWVVNSP